MHRDDGYAVVHFTFLFLPNQLGYSLTHTIKLSVSQSRVKAVTHTTDQNDSSIVCV